MRNHIEKENNILFAIGDAKLSIPVQERLLRDFENFEKDVIGEGKHEEFHGLLMKNREKYGVE